MKKIGKHSFYFEEVYLHHPTTLCGKAEALGPLGTYFDQEFVKEHPFKSFEQEEVKMIEDTVRLCMHKASLTESDIDLCLGGDLSNQLNSSYNAYENFEIPFIGMFSACSTFILSLITGAIFIDNKVVNNVIVTTSSHNQACERQFRNPTEYGGQKPITSCNTVTGCGACLLKRDESIIKLTKATLGLIHDSSLTDPTDLQRAMAPSCVDTLKRHLKDFKLSIDNYDLIITGDLSKYGSITFKALLELDGYSLNKRYVDGGNLIYDEKDKSSGGSGAGCITLVLLGYITKLFKDKSLNNCLVLATGALMNKLSTSQHQSIKSVTHALVFERVIL